MRTVSQIVVRVRGRDQRSGEPGTVRAGSRAVRTGTRHGSDVHPAAAGLRREDERRRFAQGVRQHLRVRRDPESDRPIWRRRRSLVVTALSVAVASGLRQVAQTLRRVRRGFPSGRA